MDAAASQYRERLEVVEGELADVGRRLERLYDALETGMLTLKDLSPRIQHLRHRQDQLQAAKADAEELLAQRRTSLQDVSEVVKYVDDLRTLLEQSSLAERKAFIRSFVKEIVVTGKEAVMRYSIPLLPAPLEGEADAETLGLSKRVLAIVHYGWARQGSNLVPAGYEPAALPMSYGPTLRH